MAGPARPPTERDMLHFLNGDPRSFLGVIQSTGSATNNATTTTPFNTGTAAVAAASLNLGPRSMAGTLAGKVLLMVPTGPGYVQSAGSSALTISSLTLPLAIGAVPGVPLASNERFIMTMLPDSGWLQWLPFASANLWVWELI